jgi:hypothetical protein
MASTYANPENPFCTHIKKGDGHLKHNSLTSTISWLPFLTPAQCCSSLHTYYWPSLGGLYRPQPVSPLGHTSYPSPSHYLRLISIRSFSYKNNPTISSPLFLLLAPPIEMEQRAFCKSACKIQTARNHPKERIRHLRIGPTIAPSCRISRCQVSVARKWQLASHRHLLQIGCRPSVLVSTVQCLTDHPCCAAGSRKNQNHNAEEHLDAGSATVCVLEILRAVNILWRNLH